jgi:predicted cupin superfamily sugar epimerase
MNGNAAEMISRFGLIPLPREGGFYRSIWTGPATAPGGRGSGSAILFLITQNDFSALHRLGTDEIWHFHGGDSAEVVAIEPSDGSLAVHVLGGDLSGDNLPSAVIRAGTWQGARLRQGPRGWALFGCTLAPAWDEREFELGERDALLRDFPAHAGLVRALTR